MIWTSQIFMLDDNRKRDILYGSTIPFIRVYSRRGMSMIGPIHKTAAVAQENSNILGEHGSEAGSPKFHAVDVVTVLLFGSCFMCW